MKNIILFITLGLTMILSANTSTPTIVEKNRETKKDVRGIQKHQHDKTKMRHHQTKQKDHKVEKLTFFQTGSSMVLVQKRPFFQLFFFRQYRSGKCLL